MLILNLLNSMIDRLVCTTLGGSDMSEYIADIPLIKTMNWSNRIIPLLPIPKRRFVYDDKMKWEVLIKCTVEFTDLQDTIALARTSNFVSACIPPAQLGRKAGESVYGTQHFVSETSLVTTSIKLRGALQDTYWFDETAWRGQVDRVQAVKQKIGVSEGTASCAIEILAQHTVLVDADFNKRPTDVPYRQKSPFLLADTALFVASKFRDPRPIGASLLASSCKNAYTQEDLLVSENAMLRMISNCVVLCEHTTYSTILYTRFLSKLPDTKKKNMLDAKCVLSGLNCKKILPVVEMSFWLYVQQTSAGMAVHPFMKAACFISITYAIYAMDNKRAGGLVDKQNIALFLLLLHADALVESSKPQGDRTTDSPVVAMSFISEVYIALQNEIGHLNGATEDEDLLTNSEQALKATLHQLWRQYYMSSLRLSP